MKPDIQNEAKTYYASASPRTRTFVARYFDLRERSQHRAISVGIASIAGLFGRVQANDSVLMMLELWPFRRRSDIENIGSDWAAVGNDLSHAVEHCRDH